MWKFRRFIENKGFNCEDSQDSTEHRSTRMYITMRCSPDRSRKVECLGTTSYYAKILESQCEYLVILGRAVRVVLLTTNSKESLSLRLCKSNTASSDMVKKKVNNGILRLVKTIRLLLSLSLGKHLLHLLITLTLGLKRKKTKIKSIRVGPNDISGVDEQQHMDGKNDQVIKIRRPIGNTCKLDMQESVKHFTIP